MAVLKTVVNTFRVTEGRLLRVVKKKGEKRAELEAIRLIFHKDVKVLLSEGQQLWWCFHFFF